MENEREPYVIDSLSKRFVERLQNVSYGTVEKHVVDSFAHLLAVAMCHSGRKHCISMKPLTQAVDGDRKWYGTALGRADLGNALNRDALYSPLPSSLSLDKSVM